MSHGDVVLSHWCEGSRGSETTLVCARAGALTWVVKRPAWMHPPQWEPTRHGVDLIFQAPCEANHYSRAVSLVLSEVGGPPGESPIEIDFAQAWHRIAGEYPPSQITIGPYRVDFLLPNDVVIECDGHEHHRSREQRSRDAQRDRELMHAGYMVVRFTGSEIYADADRCARQAFDLCLMRGRA